MFQLAKCKTGDLLCRIFFLSGTVFTVRSSDFVLSPSTHWSMWQVSTVIGQRLPSLKQAVAEQWDFDGPSHFWKWLLVPRKYTIYPKLRTSICHLQLELSPWLKPGHYIEVLGCSDVRISSSQSVAVHWESGWLQELLGRGWNSTPWHLQGFALSGFTPIVFPSPKIDWAWLLDIWPWVITSQGCIVLICNCKSLVSVFSLRLGAN